MMGGTCVFRKVILVLSGVLMIVGTLTISTHSEIQAVQQVYNDSLPPGPIM